MLWEWEQPVARLLVRGVSNNEIARAREVEMVTAKKHLGRILRKVGARNRTQAAVQLADGSETMAIGD